MVKLKYLIAGGKHLGVLNPTGAFIKPAIKGG